MTGTTYTRRAAIGLLGAVAASRALAGPARPGLADPSAPYRVPGGRLGFARPQGIAPTTNGWILQSEDHTFQVRVQETVFVAGKPNALLDKDARVWTSSAITKPGFIAKRFTSGRAGNLDNGTDSIVLADDGWVGEVSVSISNLTDEAETAGGVIATTAVADPAGSPPQGSGLVARWRDAAELVLGSVTVRPAPLVDVALGEFKIGIDVGGLHPRLAGDTLYLSGQAPRSVDERLGAGVAHFYLPAMSNVDYLTEEANADLFDFFVMTGTELAGGKCRAVQTVERSVPGGRYATSVRLFGKRRQQEMIAVYTLAERAASIATLVGTVRTLRFLDEG